MCSTLDGLVCTVLSVHPSSIFAYKIRCCFFLCLFCARVQLSTKHNNVQWWSTLFIRKREKKMHALHWLQSHKTKTMKMAFCENMKNQLISNRDKKLQYFIRRRKFLWILFCFGRGKNIGESNHGFMLFQCCFLVVFHIHRCFLGWIFVLVLRLLGFKAKHYNSMNRVNSACRFGLDRADVKWGRIKAKWARGINFAVQFVQAN